MWDGGGGGGWGRGGWGKRWRGGGNLALASAITETMRKLIGDSSVQSNGDLSVPSHPTKTVISLVPLQLFIVFVLFVCFSFNSYTDILVCRL